jgi:hypothetical protein
MPSIAHFSEDDARKLAANIIDYWVAQGYPRKAIDVKTEVSGMDVVVRSNLRNGQPPGKPAIVPKPYAS